MVAGMKIIAFDLGSTMAYAEDKHVNHRTFTGSRLERFCAIQRWLAELMWQPYDIVVYETPLVRGQDATRSLWGIAGILEATVTQAQKPIISIAVPTIKKFATGDGMAAKIEMLHAAKKFGYRGDNEHEADAVCLLAYAKANLERAHVY